jgi:hypothetical protein
MSQDQWGSVCYVIAALFVCGLVAAADRESVEASGLDQTFKVHLAARREPQSYELLCGCLGGHYAKRLSRVTLSLPDCLL